MKTRTKTFFIVGLITTFLAIFLLPALSSVTAIDPGVITITHAQESYQFLEPIPGVGDEINVDNGFSSFVQTVITMVIGFTILAAIIMIVAAGFQYMTSVSQDKTSTAKQTIQNAVLGLVLALASVVILQTINPQLIELKSVETVTTSGSMFVIPDQEHEGTVHVPEANTHGNKYCMDIRGEWEAGDIFGWGSSDDRYLCYQTEEQCEDGKELAGEAEETGSWYSELQCQYYYESTGQLVLLATEETPEEIIYENNIVGVGVSKEEAIAQCKSNVRAIGIKEPYRQCFGSGECVSRCDEPVSLPDDWDKAKACPDNIANDNSNFCKNGIAACEAGSDSGECYLTPTQMFGNKSAGCDDCVFVSDLPGERDNRQTLVGRFKYNNMCSGNGGNYCRIEGGLAGELFNFHELAIASDTIEGFDYEITEVFPPTTEHAKQCHYNGTCVDVGVRPPSIRDGNNYQEKSDYIRKVFSAAEESGMKACYEVNSEDEKNRILQEAQEEGLDSLNESNIITVPTIGENHFSVYKNENESCR